MWGGVRADTCVPDGSLAWVSGLPRKEVAAQVEAALAQANMQAQVQATGYGERDSCGHIVPMGVDLTVTLADRGLTGLLQGTTSAEAIRDVIARQAPPGIGQISVVTAVGDTLRFPLNSATLEGASMAAQASGWSPITTSTSPSARYLHAMAHDSHRHVTVMFGGDSTSSARLNDTWEYDGSHWSQVATPLAPPGRVNIDQTMVYDSQRLKMVLFGGLGASGYLSDTWEYASSQWTANTLSQKPAARDAHAMAFDADRGVTVLFGGYTSGGTTFSDTWEYTTQWQTVAPAAAPPARFHHAMVFDARRHVVVLFGGRTQAGSWLGDTWEYDGTTWRQAAPVQSPPGRDNHSLAYDSARGVVVLFGGEGSGGRLNDLWEYDGSTWRQITTPQAPAPRTEMSLVYNSLRAWLL